MTPNDLIADLRDIHTPPAAGDAAALLSTTPLIVFAVLLAAGIYWAHRRKTNWRREAAARLAEVQQIADPAERWAALTVLFRQVARHTARDETPAFLFQPRESGGPDADKRLVAVIERSLG